MQKNKYRDFYVFNTNQVSFTRLRIGEELIICYSWQEENSEVKVPAG